MNRITISDIARAVGVSKATVSMALRKHPEVSSQTVERVMQAARELGYRPDPQLAKIAASRWRGKSASEGSMLAFVANLHPDHLVLIPPEALEHPMPFLLDYENPPDWQKYLSGHLHFRGAQERAAELGYQMQYFLCKPGDNISALSNTLYHRGIQGVMLSPIFDRAFLDHFLWDRFATVAVADHYVLPPTDFVVPKLSTHILMASNQLYRRGYQRPGLVLYHERIQHLNNHILRGVFLSLCETAGILDCVPSPCYIEHRNLGALREWFEMEKPDVIIGFNDFVYDTLLQMGIRMPDEVALVSLSSRSGPGRQIAGLFDPDFQMGRTGVDVLDQKLRHGMMGSSTVRNFYTIQTRWVDGPTLPVKAGMSDDVLHEIQSKADFLDILPESDIAMAQPAASLWAQ